MPKSRSSRSKSPQKPLTAAEIASQLEREKIFQNVQEMFKETVDADVIHMVLTECNWKGEEAIDKLLAIGENSEIQRQYKTKSQLQQIAEGVFGSICSDEHPRYGPPQSSSSSLQSSPLSQKDKVIQRPVKVQSAEKLANSKTETQGPDVLGNSHLQIPLEGLSSRGSGSLDAQLSPEGLVDDIELDLHFPRLPVRKAALSRSSTSSPISSHRSYSTQVQSGSQPDLITEAQTAYQQQYDDAAGAQRWEQCKNILSDHYMKSITGVRRRSEDLQDRKNEKGPHISKSKSTEESSSSMMSAVFLDDPAIIQSQTERPKSESSRSFPVRLLSRSPDDESFDTTEGNNGVKNGSRLDSADLDETVLKCIYEVHDDLCDQTLFTEPKQSSSGRTSEMDSERLSAGTPESSGHVTPVPMTLPVIGLSAHAAEFVPRQPKGNTGEKSPSSKDVPNKEPVKAVRSNSIEIKSGAKNVRIKSPTVQKASASPLTVSPGHSPVISPPSPNVGSPASNLAGSPMFITPKWQPLFPRIPTTPPPPLRPPVSVIAASGTRYINPPPPHHLPPPQYRLPTAGHLPFSSRIVYPVAPPPPVFHVAGISPRIQPIQQPMSPHQMPTSVEERARIATGQPIMATSEVSRHVAPPNTGLAMQLINKPSIERNIQKVRELHQAGKKVLVIIRGLPGSGKSTLSRALKHDGVVLSTDDYFMKGDMYDYNPEKLAESHQWNRERAKEAMKMGTSPIIVDNTNTQRWEFKPYVSMALNNNYHVEMMEPDTPWKNNPKELARLTVHGVPKDHIQRMLQRYERNITVDMLTTKKKGNTPTSQGSTASQSSFDSDTSRGKGVPSTAVLAGDIGEDGIEDWDMNHEGPVVWSHSPKNAGSRSSSIDKEMDPSTGNILEQVSDSTSGSLNGDKMAADKGLSGPDVVRKRPSLHGLNSRARSLEKSEAVTQKEVLSKVVEKKYQVPRTEIDLSEETVKFVEDLVSEYVKDKSLSEDDLNRVEEELKALLQIYPMDDKERVAAERLIGQKLHGAPTDDVAKDVLENSVADSCNKGLILQVKAQHGKGDLEQHVCAEITNDDIEEENAKEQHVSSSTETIDSIESNEQKPSACSNQASDPLKMISDTEDIAQNESREVNCANGATDIETRYWGINKASNEASAEAIEPVSTNWDDTQVHHNDWSDEILTSNNGVVRPQRWRKLRHNSDNSKLKEDSVVSQPDRIHPLENLGDNDELEMEEITGDVNEELDISTSSKHTSEESSSKDYENSDMNISGNSSYLTALDNSQSSSDNKLSDGLGDSQESMETIEVNVGLADESKSKKSMEKSTDSTVMGVTANVKDWTGDNEETENLGAGAKEYTSDSTESGTLNTERVTEETGNPSGNVIEYVNVSKNIEEESYLKVIDNNSLSLLKDSYADSGIEENTLARSQEKFTDDLLTEINTNSHEPVNNAQDVESIIDEEQDLFPDENQNTLTVAVGEECNGKINTDADKSEEGPVKNTTEKRKKAPRKKMAANFHGPFFKDTDKENFLTGDWNKFPITSEHLYTSHGNSAAINSGKIESSGSHQETMTTEEDFTTLNILCQGGFVDSDVHYIISKKRKVVNAETDAVKPSNADRSISDRYTINQSTSTHDLQSENSESVAFLKTCFPNTKEDELECVLANCDNNVEWAIDLLLEWNYDSQLSSEEKKDFVVRLESITTSKSPIPAPPKVSNNLKQPSFLRDMCFNLIEENKIASKEELEQQLILTGKERLDRIEDENLTKIRLRRSSSMSETSPRGHKRSLNDTGSAISRSLSTPVAIHSNKTEAGAYKEDSKIDNLKDLVERADVFSPGPDTQEESVLQENGAIELDGEGVLSELDSLREIKAESVETTYTKEEDSNESLEEMAQNEETFNHLEDFLDSDLDYHAVAERFEASRVGAVTMKMDGNLVKQLEEKFGAVDDHSRGGASVKVEIDHSTAWRLYQCLKHSLVDTRQRIRRQLAEDEELARRLQEEENLNSVVAENQPAVTKTGPPPLVGLSGYMTNMPVKPKPVQRSRPVKPLVEIMEEEAQIQSKEQKFQKLVENEGGHKVLATLMKRNKLYDRFPDIDRTMLDEVFQNNCFNLTDTVHHIETHLGEGLEIPGIEGDGGLREEKLLEATKWQSIQDRLNSFLYMANVSKDYQDGAEPEYEDFRGEAHLHHRLRHECFQKAQEAYRRGFKQVASFYSQQGHLHTQKIKEANMRASELILEDRNNDIENNMTLDLHGLHVDEAIAALERILPQKQREQRKGFLTVITGRGSHSRGGVARLRPSVLAYLRRQQYNITESQQGIIKVSLKYKKLDR